MNGFFIKINYKYYSLAPCVYKKIGAMKYSVILFFLIILSSCTREPRCYAYRYDALHYYKLYKNFDTIILNVSPSFLSPTSMLNKQYEDSLNNYLKNGYKIDSSDYKDNRINMGTSFRNVDCRLCEYIKSLDSHNLCRTCSNTGSNYDCN